MASRRPPSDRLAAWLAGQRWCAARSHGIAAVAIEDEVPLPGGAFTVLRATLDDGSVHRYAAPLRPGTEPEDALDDPGFWRALLDLMARGGRAAGSAGELVGGTTAAFPAEVPVALAVRRLEGEQSNTSVLLGERLIGKHFRRLAPGINPELEVTRFLTERTRFRHAARLAGWLEYRPRTGPSMTVAVVQERVLNARDGWEWMLDQLRAWLAAAPGPPSLDRVEVVEPAPASLAALRRLGERTGELHRALASDASDPAFAPEPITAADVAAWSAQVEQQIAEARRALGGRRLADVPAAAGALAGLVGCAKIRHHGDFHLGQTLWVEDRRDFVIIDFEGEPLRPLEVRRRKHAALRDVAGMLRSIDYAAITAGGDGASGTQAGGWAERWERRARRAFVAGYRSATADAEFVPRSEREFLRATAVFELEKAAYEIVYELAHRPRWADIPVGGFARAAAAVAAPAAPAQREAGGDSGGGG